MNLPKTFTENKKYEWTQMKEVDWFMYIRDYDNKPIGIIIIDKNKCGYSICNDKDDWDKAFGVFKAIMRLCSQKTLEERISEFIHKLGTNNTDKQYYYKCDLVLNCLRHIDHIFESKERKIIWKHHIEEYPYFSDTCKYEHAKPYKKEKENESK